MHVPCGARTMRHECIHVCLQSSSTAVHTCITRQSAMHGGGGRSAIILHSVLMIDGGHRHCPEG